MLAAVHMYLVQSHPMTCGVDPDVLGNRYKLVGAIPKSLRTVADDRISMPLTQSSGTMQGTK